MKKSFESRLEALRQYKQQHGHLNIERKDDKSLYKFCDNIRRRRGNPGKNLMEKIKALDEIGFSWEVARTGAVQYIEEDASADHRPVLAPGSFQLASVSHSISEHPTFSSRLL